MIRRFVQHQHVRVGGGELRERRAVSFAAAETADRLKHHVADDSESREQIATLLLHELLVVGTDRVDHLLIIGQA